MRLRAIVLGLSLLAGAAAPACAEPIDMATVTCGDLLRMDRSTAGDYFIWLHGYFSAKSGDSTFDADAVNGDIGTITGYCTDNPEITVMQAVRRLSR